MNLQELHPEDANTNQLAIQSRIDERSARGGGRVRIPAGTWPCGSLELKSGIELHLEHGARLLASTEPGLFPPLAEHDGKLTANSRGGALLQAKGAVDIAVTGSGTLDGGGTPESTPDWATAQNVFRPAMVYFEDCERVTLRNLQIINSKWWTVHLRRCRDSILQGLRMRHTWPNSDGIDPDGCKGMIISDCNLVCGDDCIVLKSTQGDPCEDIVITNCVLETSCAALKLGTESRGTFRNITMSNCVARADVCFGLYMKDGGLMENILAEQVICDTASTFPILIDATARDYREGEAGMIRNVHLHHCTLRGPGRAWISGTPRQPLENIRLSNLSWHITAPLPDTLPPRPLGSARTVINPGRPAYEQHRAQVLATHLRGFQLEHLQLSGDTRGRETLWTDNVQ